LEWEHPDGYELDQDAIEQNEEAKTTMLVYVKYG